MTTPRRPLAGCAVGLSISESDESRPLGFPGGQVNRLTVHVVSALFGQGVAVVFGHDWREDGVMESHALPRQMQPVAPDASTEDTSALLQNVLPWPDRPLLPEKLRDQLSCALRIEQAGLPDELRKFQIVDPPTAQQLPEYDYLRALTHLRRRLEDRTAARVCIGGRLRRSQGRYPGVVEEAMLCLSARKPLYLVGLLGGAARRLIDAIEGRPMPPAVFESAPVADKYTNPPPSAREPSPAAAADRIVMPASEGWSLFKNAGLDELSRTNRLTSAENRELFETPAIERAIRLVLLGFSRVFYQSL